MRDLSWIFLLGDPAWLYHPVRLIGLLIEKGEKIIRKCLPKTRGGERLGGVVLVIFVVSISALVPLGILLAAYRFSTPLGLLIESFFCYQILAVKSLKVESDRVYRALKEEGPDKRAKSRVHDRGKRYGRIIGRRGDKGCGGDGGREYL